MLSNVESVVKRDARVQARSQGGIALEGETTLTAVGEPGGENRYVGTRNYRRMIANLLGGLP